MHSIPRSGLHRGQRKKAHGRQLHCCRKCIIIPLCNQANSLITKIPRAETVLRDEKCQWDLGRDDASAAGDVFFFVFIGPSFVGLLPDGGGVTANRVLLVKFDVHVRTQFSSIRTETTHHEVHYLESHAAGL